MRLPNSKLIVLTGGPCAGKTTIGDVVGHAFKKQVVIVPEAASLLFKGGFPRWAEQESRCALQRAIYHTQRELEKSYSAHHRGKVLLLDRGTLDGSAYWPWGTDDFFSSLNTSLEKELTHYNRVIYLESASQKDYNINKKNNPNRIESWEEARDLDAKAKKAWIKHPHIHFVKNKRAFSEKIAEVFAIIEDVLIEK